MFRKYADLDRECVWRTGGWFRNRVRECEALAVMTDGALDVYVHGEHDAKGYMDSFREEVLQILQKLNISAAVPEYPRKKTTPSASPVGAADGCLFYFA